MEAEIGEQASCLAENSGSYLQSLQEAVSAKQFDLVVLCARGSSDHAALYARYLIEIHLGIPVSLAAPSVLTKYGTQLNYKNSLVVGISQSGAAPDVSEVLSDARARGQATLAITNTPGSRMTKEAASSLLLNVGKEQSVAATKTYTASLLAVYQLARALGANLPDPNPYLPDAAFFASAKQQAESVFGEFTRKSPVIVLARGYSYCSAQETALKLMECSLIPAKSYSIADFEHGPKAVAGPGSVALVFGKALSDLSAQGCTVVTAPEFEGFEPLKPIKEILFGQLIALYTARGRGLDPDHPQNLRKVTETL